MESTRLARATRSLAGNSHWSRAIVCGTHLSSGRAESDARVASGRARLARPACVRTNLRGVDGGPFSLSGAVTERRPSLRGADAQLTGLLPIAPARPPPSRPHSGVSQ